MTEIWFSYGPTEAVLDVRAENEGARYSSDAGEMDDGALSAALAEAGLAGIPDLAVLHDTPAVRRTVASLFMLCAQKSAPPPRVLADRGVLRSLRAGLPEGCRTAELEAGDPGDLVFVSEVEFDGLFGYETAATRLLRRYGGEAMLTAYSRRDGNSPSPGRRTGAYEAALGFADRFEARAVDIVAGSGGMSGVWCGHPSKSGAPGMLEGSGVLDAEPHAAAMIGTGRAAGNATLSGSLRSLWNCAGAVKKGGLAILVAECAGGLGSAALRRRVEGGLPDASLRSPARYVGGMEDLLYLADARDRYQVALVSVLPELYSEKLGIVPVAGAGAAMGHALKAQGQRLKAAVITDGARILLR
ncbi:MAG: transcriptional regulator [Nitrosopumilus sp.]|nr:transcriptional regulator [Nitrosopumilus sp.]MDA7943821.1 transcriptional regulator [Nitrosopumilus sp.]MDA7953214.1 transcriptional regulator [Nitrosopumilus sp.]MDA7957971.1 transcriptional regulator [Nitrosopumilus sp.]MDA7959762.1 transcriptional regulator [Nitrosopumilus sp.]